MMLEHLGEHAAATRLEAAVRELVADGTTVTYDLRAAGDARPAARTSAIAEALADRLRSSRSG
jgi:isocitrate dehydrogenase (NAD+)